MKSFIRSFLVIISLGVLAGAALMWSGLYNVAADDPHWKATLWLLNEARERSVEAHSRGSVAPSLQGERIVERGLKVSFWWPTQPWKGQNEQAKLHDRDEPVKKRLAAQADLTNAQREFNRFEDLYRRGADSQETRDNALTTIEKAIANLATLSSSSPASENHLRASLEAIVATCLPW
jgi:hypothetical protein